MDRVSELNSILGEVFSASKHRLDCLTKIIISMFIVRTVNLREIAVAFDSTAMDASRYKRLKRFFAQFQFDYAALAVWILQLFFSQDEKLYLTMDRTNWFWGKSKINVFMLGIAYEGIAIPLLWKLLDKAGNASAKEHCELVDSFINKFDKSRIAGILGDREFASEAFFTWCNEKELPFYVRIKDCSLVKVSKKKICTAKEIFNRLNCREKLEYGLAIELYNTKVYLAGSRSERGELMVVATNQLPKNAIAIYLRRWEIECLFSSLKGRGFRFEETHITKLERIEKLVAVLAIAFCWAHKVGEWRAIKRPITFNKYRGSKRPQFSYFRYGLDFIRDKLINIYTNIQEFIECLKLLRQFPDPKRTLL